MTRARPLTRAVVLVSLAALEVAAGACRAAPAPPADTAPLATLTRTSAFFGGGAAYEVSIETDGTVHYQGKANVGVIGARTKTLTPQQLKELIAAFDKAGYFSLNDKYEEGPTDNTWTYTSFSREGRTKKVAHYMSGNAPPALWELEGRIDAIVGTQEWVYLSPEEARRRQLEAEAKARADHDAMLAGLPGWKTQLADPDPDVRRKAAFGLLGARGHKDAEGKPLIGAAELTAVAPVIAEALTHPSSAVRKDAAWQLMAFGPEAAALVPVLTTLLSDADPYMRKRAASTLYRIGRPAAVSAIPALERALRDPDPEVRGEASRALPALGYRHGRVLEILIADLRSSDEPVRFAAAKVLGWDGAAAATARPALRQALGDTSPRVREAAQQALTSIGGTP